MKFLQQLLACSYAKVNHLSFSTYGNQNEANNCLVLHQALLKSGLDSAALVALLTAPSAELGPDATESDESFLGAILVSLRSGAQAEDNSELVTARQDGDEGKGKGDNSNGEGDEGESAALPDQKRQRLC